LRARIVLRHTGIAAMKFDLLYELQPKPHDARSEYRCYQGL
jgi:hypothetical protein